MKTPIAKLLKDQGITTYGFCEIPATYTTRFQGLTHAISLAVPLSDYVVDEIKDSPTVTYYQHYRTINAYIDHVTVRIGLQLAANGYRYVAVPASQTVHEGMSYAGIFPHKTAAVLSGIGTIGKNALLITEQYGTRVRLGTILTDMPLPTTENVNNSACGACNLCVTACPARAITGEQWQAGMQREALFDAKACSEYMKAHYQHIGRGSVCGLCMRVCPKHLHKNQ
ncbi:MAG: epoxyqueuosine reductase [Hyphomonadaceae bacterium]|nr:epoxyqueuosine reductase [Clostridia bacterium]